MEKELSIKSPVTLQVDNYAVDIRGLEITIEQNGGEYHGSTLVITDERIVKIRLLTAKEVGQEK